MHLTDLLWHYDLVTDKLYIAVFIALGCEKGELRQSMCMTDWRGVNVCLEITASQKQHEEITLRTNAQKQHEEMTKRTKNGTWDEIIQSSARFRDSWNGQAKRLVISPGMMEQFCWRKGRRSSKDLEEHQPTRLTTVQRHWSPFPHHLTWDKTPCWFLTWTMVRTTPSCSLVEAPSPRSLHQPGMEKQGQDTSGQPQRGQDTRQLQ